ncbi:oxygen-independent coproporphyrinogen III oxidase [Brevundimonas sp. SL130]|uniref:oxygen-independent coproporphyrinogen III oxidase n=1 Tax=Brevundimonas sp. SL130 TaxID=2995143 RepID=UPI00226D3E14|nr:oxygen-independent coproporphyrinogen III oxidase [Brevundimonas sp. SL130]WAC60944.1 oxygen-independent coproporphyrinogen III oxidase [Brevundimonas sp. SL130]
MSLSSSTGALTTRALIARYDAHAPRYTSYPTAAQFTPAVGAADWGAWLSAAPLDRAVSLYLHIPFCKRLCWYCGCNTRAMNRVSAMSSYVDLLLKEADLVLSRIGRPVRVGSIHLGGGTPNMLPPEELERLFAGLAARFDLGDCFEIAAELDPEVLTQDWVEAAGRVGLSRASLGVQDLSPKVQAAVNRPESFETIRWAAEALRAQGVTSLNLDLMYGLPLQAVENVITTVAQVATLRPDRIALFGYAHVPWMKPHQKLINEADLPGPEARFAQSQAAARYLVQKGWQAVGLDHFALPHDSMAAAARAGRLRRNFQGYTTDEAPVLIGLGASSISRTPQGFVQNLTQEREWRAAVEAGDLPVARGVALDPRDAFVGEIIERLMCDFAVDVAAIAGRHGRALSEVGQAWPRLLPFQLDGLAEVSGSVVTVTDLGRPFVRAVCAAFDPGAVDLEKRHARVV